MSDEKKECVGICYHCELPADDLVRCAGCGSRFCDDCIDWFCDEEDELNGDYFCFECSDLDLEVHDDE
jgi:hypothetical protein